MSSIPLATFYFNTGTAQHMTAVSSPLGARQPSRFLLDRAESKVRTAPQGEGATCPPLGVRSVGSVVAGGGTVGVT